MEELQESGTLVARSQRLNETADTSLDHSHQILPTDVTCARVSVLYISVQLYTHIHYYTFSTK